MLEFWRPYFFLTDDNLDGGYPFFIEMGSTCCTASRRLSPTTSSAAITTCCATHILRLASALSPRLAAGRHAVPSRASSTSTRSCSSCSRPPASSCLADYLRREMALTISDGWLTFFTLSFTYSMIALTTGASWLNFVGNHSALPWLALGILQRNARGAAR